MNTTPYITTPLSPGLWRLEDGMVSCYLVAGSKRAVLVDAGVSGGDLLGAAKAITEKPITLVCTHADHDHVMSAPQFGEVWLHPSEYERFLQQKIDPVPMRPLWDGDIIDLGGRSLTVIHIPGHTPGSIALLDGEARFLLTGDSVAAHNIYMFGSGRCMPAYTASMERLVSMSSRFDILHPAHGAPAVPPDILPELMDASRRLLAGELEGLPPPREGMPCKLYMTLRAGFLY